LLTEGCGALARRPAPVSPRDARAVTDRGQLCIRVCSRRRRALRSRQAEAQGPHPPPARLVKDRARGTTRAAVPARSARSVITSAHRISAGAAPGDSRCTKALRSTPRLRQMDGSRNPKFPKGASSHLNVGFSFKSAVSSTGSIRIASSMACTPSNPPARSTFQVAALPRSALIEIEAIAEY